MAVQNDVVRSFPYVIARPQSQSLWQRLTSGWVTYFSSLALSHLLSYRYYVLHPRASISSIHQFAIAWITNHSPRLGMQQYADALPTFPVNPLSQVLAKQKESIKPILSDYKYHAFCKELDDFKRGDGYAIQARLVEKACTQRDWMERDWIDYAYLENRWPLNVTSWYGLGALLPANHTYGEEVAFRRPARVIFLTLHVRDMIRRGELPATVGGHPFCMHQFNQIFGANRLPGMAKDVFEVQDSKHIVVFLHGHCFKVTVYKDNGEPLHEHFIEDQLKQIAVGLADLEQGVSPARLTWQNRVAWAQDRAALIEENRDSFEIMDKALFTVRLSDAEPQTEEELARLLFLSLYDQWADKGMNLTFCLNGMYGGLQEHTMGEATIASEVTRLVSELEEEIAGLNEKSIPSAMVRKVEHGLSISDAQGYPANETAPKVQPIEWKLSDAYIEKLRSPVPNDGEQYAGSIDLKVSRFSHFGKEEIKKWRCSPDSVVQIALQLAYVRLRRKTPFVYETQTARRYYHGRTETVRSTTCASAQFCRIMDSHATTEQKQAALRRAVKDHVRLKREAFVGEGIDRQLMMLARYTKEGETKLPTEPSFDLLTSQTPISRTRGGGFGPGTGTGISYNIQKDCIDFHISRKRGELTSSRFYQAIEQALVDLRSLCHMDSQA